MCKLQNWKKIVNFDNNCQLTLEKKNSEENNCNVKVCQIQITFWLYSHEEKKQ